MKLLGIATRTKNQAPMNTHEWAEISLSDGVVGDFRRRPGKRQVTVMSKAQWQSACVEIGTDLPWTIRRANLLVDDYHFSANDLGKIIQIGDVLLQVMDETEPCHKMDQQHEGLRAALTPQWRGGVCCKVINSGELKIGEEVLINPK
ncbi:MOSC domain-containing protein [Aliiglaciecola sp.]|nr:MOSC domain-containing protein [Aliiglaciecola sp.]